MFMRRPNARPQACRRSPSAEYLVLGRPHVANRFGCSLSFIGLATSGAVSLAASGLIYLSIFSSWVKFGVIIDGGSTGTRIHVFGYTDIWGGTPIIDHGLVSSMKVAPGLSAFAYTPEQALQSLTELLVFAKERVPKSRWGKTEVRLMATAGLRLLDGNLAEGILESCRSVLRGSGFKFQDDWASVISGSDEGVYAWIAANYALGTLGKSAQETTGIVELGGASTQITFVPSEPMPPEFALVLKFGRVIYNLYSHSFLHLGQNTAYAYLRQLLMKSSELKTSSESLSDGFYIDPCTPRGYLYAAELENVSNEAFSTKKNPRAFGNFSDCRSAAVMLLRKEKDGCLYKNCNIGSSFVPKLRGKLIATENFFHTSKFFGLGPSSFLSDLMLAGEQFCEEDWSKLRIKYHALEEEDLLRYCFSAAYIVALLHDSLGIAMNDTGVVFANQVGGIPLDWALGAFIMQKAAPGAGLSGWISVINLTNPPRFLSIFGPIFVLTFLGWRILKWWKPCWLNQKTRRDMQNGKHFNSCSN